MLSNGQVWLNDGVEKEGVAWMGEEWKAYDTGQVDYFDKESARKSKANGDPIDFTSTFGLVSFGTIDGENFFHLLPEVKGKKVDWKMLRDINVNPSAKQGEGNAMDMSRWSNVSKVLDADTRPVFVRESDVERLYQEEIAKTGTRIVLLAVPALGPPMVLPIGQLLKSGKVHLDAGLEVPGVYWESPDRIFYDNGTVVYKVIMLPNVSHHLTSTSQLFRQLTPLRLLVLVLEL